MANLTKQLLFTILFLDRSHELSPQPQSLKPFLCFSLRWHIRTCNYPSNGCSHVYIHNAHVNKFVYFSLVNLFLISLIFRAPSGECKLGTGKDFSFPTIYLNGYTGEGNGNPLQYSCLENPMDGGAWKAAVHGVAEGQTQLSDFTFTSHFPTLEKEMATHPSFLAWRISGMGEPGGLPSMGSHRVGHD